MRSTGIQLGSSFAKIHYINTQIKVVILKFIFDYDLMDEIGM